MADRSTNFAYGTVLTAPSPPTTGTSLVLNAGQGALMPTPPFEATVWPTAAQPLSTNAETPTCTAIVGDTLTLVRGVSPRSIVAGDQFAKTINVKDLTDREGPRAPAADLLVRAGYGQIAVGDFEIPSGVTVELEADGNLEIL